MKNNILFLLAAGIFAFSSCGTSNRASYAGLEYQNGIYYTPDTRVEQAYAQSQTELSDLQQQTRQTIGNGNRVAGYNADNGVKTIFVGDTNRVDIDYNPDIIYSIVDDDESYEARLRKFDSPSYTINIDMRMGYGWDDPWFNPWWGPYYSWYRPYSIAWRTGWYNPWWDSYYSWYGPGWGYSWWNSGWYDPWWGWHGWYGWYDPWRSPWWYDHGWGPGPGPAHHHGADIYYGRRTSATGGSTYSTANRPNTAGSTYRRNPNLSQIRGNTYNSAGRPAGQPATNTNSGGSVYRRGGNNGIHNGAVYNNSAADKGQTGTAARPNYGTSQKNGSSSQSSMYRRSSTPAKSNSGTTGTTVRSNSGSTYSTPARSNTGTSYNRSTSPVYNSGTYSTGSSTGRSSSSSTGSSTTRSSGSSYRRR